MRKKIDLRARFAINFAKFSQKIIFKLHIGSGATFPGFVASIIDPNILTKLSKLIPGEIIATMGTNGKTTTNTLVAKYFEGLSKSVVISDNGANMTNGIISAFINKYHKGTLHADCASIEVDELASKKVFRLLKPDTIIITNISRDQLDRFGEIDIVINHIKEAIKQTPNSTLVINADDSFSNGLILDLPNKVVYYGVNDKTNIDETDNFVNDTMLCPKCKSKLKYNLIHYSHIGDYYCPSCNYKRPTPKYTIKDFTKKDDKSTFVINDLTLEPNTNTLYNAYNILSVYTALSLNNINPTNFINTINSFDFKNKREEVFSINGSKISLYLAKNPVSFKEKIKQVISDKTNKDIVININDTYQDGEDVSWLWDVDFEKLDNEFTNNIYCSGMRKYDMGLRLKYDNINVSFISNLKDGITYLINNGSKNIHIIVNYSGLYSTNNLLNELSKEDLNNNTNKGIEDYKYTTTAINISTDITIKIAHLLPDLLNLYGDRGNLQVLKYRLLRRGINVQVDKILLEDNFDVDSYDIIFIGGGSDKEQRIANSYLLKYQNDIKKYVEDNKIIIAVCGGYQLLGNYYQIGSEKIEGLSLVDITTKSGSPRILGNVIIKNELLGGEIIGYENHAGRTDINDYNPLGKVFYGTGNNDNSHYEGIIYKNIFGTYLHGPLLPKNPQLVDYILKIALDNKLNANNALIELDDTLEEKAREVISKRYHDKKYIIKEKIKEKI